MRLDALLPGFELGAAGAVDVREVRDDSRAVAAGDAFVAVPGNKADGRVFVRDALARGAAAVVTAAGDGEADIRAAAAASGVACVVVPDVRRALAIMAARRYAAVDALTLAAVTGTNGKTTTTHLLEAMLLAAGHTPGLVGTVHYRWPGGRKEAPLTTPGALALHALFAEMRDAGCTHAVLEASSHALAQGRLAGCRFRAAGLTNVTQDHLDYHGTMEAYEEAKAILFRELLADGGTGVVFADREDGRRMRAAIRGRVLTVSATPGVGADVAVRAATLDGHGVRAEISTPGGSFTLRSPLVGDFNLQNLTLATGLAVALDVPLDAIARAAESLAGVPGRLERVDNDAGVLCVVDYAHTPDGLERAMAALRPLARRRLITVFGCGGDRDPKKRPIMGEAAARDSDLCIVTSDNPRTEDPGCIVEMILEGVARVSSARLDAAALDGEARGVHVELDRRMAIRRAIEASRAGDVVLLAGKGHEDYQIIGTTKIHFDDREEAAAAFARRGGTT